MLRNILDSVRSNLSSGNISIDAIDRIDINNATPEDMQNIYSRLCTIKSDQNNYTSDLEVLAIERAIDDIKNLPGFVPVVGQVEDIETPSSSEDLEI